MTTKLMIDRFLSWPLPESLCSDPCASMPGYPHRTGTNLMTAEQAKAMLDYVLAAPSQPEGDGLEVRAVEEYHRTNGRIEYYGLCRLSDAQRAIAELREEISDLHTTMMAAEVGELVEALRRIAYEPAEYTTDKPTICTCEHKLQGTGAVFIQSIGLLLCNNCKGWQEIKRPIK